jgi:myo-inositol 2-dehydrogenase/D-chiro-inositol 1-dehydrogenase
MIAAAEAGKHIFCEKPISNDLATIDHCLEVVRARGVKLLVGFQRRFDSNFRHIREEIERGAIGEVRMFHIHSRDPAPPPAEYLAKSGGIFLDMCSHDYDMARFVTGQEIEQVYVVGKAFDPEAQAANDLDTQITVLRMSGGAFGTIDNSRRCSYGYDQRIEVFGAEGSLTGMNKSRHTVVAAGQHGYQLGRPYDFFMDRYLEAYGNIMAAFVEMIERDLEPPVSGLDGRAPVLAAMAAALSVRENRPVPLSEVDIRHRGAAL